MPVRGLLGNIRWRAISALSRRDFPLPEPGPIVSFTFDDFPQTALHVGGAILKKHGVRGTFYAAMGLMDQKTSVGRNFCEQDLRMLLEEGHELGSHTFGHLSGRSTGLDDFEADVLKGRRAVEQFTGSSQAHQFSYPYGHATLRSKQRIGARASSCRGIVPGINQSPVDLNLLHANSLYSSSFDLNVVGQLLTDNDKRRGWLIFYTHDISDQPSPFGCKPEEFESVVSLAVNICARVWPVGRAISGERQLADAPARDLTMTT